MRAVIVSLLIAPLLTAAAAAQQPKQPPKKKTDPAFAPVVDDPKLPRVLLIGDSISIGYTPATRKLLTGVANVHRIPEDGGPTSNGIAKIDKWLGAGKGGGKWDVIHFNWGLHDIKLDTGMHQVPIEQYEKNLWTLVKTMKATGAKLIWASTTPVPEGKLSPKRDDKDVAAYNAVAKKIMQEESVAINDLYAFALPRLKEIQRPVNVHFTDAGSAVLAEEVAKAIRDALKAK
jgi:lysophospholipase L1-like esterase